MDCVTDAGEAGIVYCADLRWRGVHAWMGSVLTSRSGERPRTRTSLGRYSLTQTADEIAIEHACLKVSGWWHSMSPAVQRTVYEEPNGSIVWNCIQPASRVLMRIGERDLTGLGYAECLTVMLPSWRLPIRHLVWGRFVSADHALAWVDWQGEYCTRFAVYDGRESPLLAASESEVVIEDASLRIGPGESLRSGQLSSTILSGAAGLKRLFPARLLNIREQKWKSCGTLAHSSGTSHGWIIQEVVDWEP